MSEPEPPRTYSPIEDAPPARRIDPTEREFEDWIPVAAAVAFMEGPWTHELAARLAKRLRDGSLLGGAREVRWWEDGALRVKRLVSIDPSVWVGVAGLENGGHSAWEHSEFTSRIRDDSDLEWLEKNFYEVRLEWDRLFRAFPELRKHFTRSVRSAATSAVLSLAPTASTLDKLSAYMLHATRPAPITDHLGPNAPATLTAPLDGAAILTAPIVPAEIADATSGGSVSSCEIDGWYAALSPTDQTRSVRWLHAAANAIFSPRRVARKQVEHFKKGQRRGRRPNG